MWKHVTLTIDGGTPEAPGTSKLYEDGVLVATNNNITAKPSQIGEPDGTSTRNFIGRSAYAGDLRSRATIRDFRIYTVRSTPATRRRCRPRPRPPRRRPTRLP